MPINAISNTNVPTIAPSINPPTEQVAKENNIRERIEQPAKTTKTQKKKKIKKDDKDVKGNRWEPYKYVADEKSHQQTTADEDLFSYLYPEENIYEKNSAIELLNQLISSNNYISKTELGYCMSYKFPPELQKKVHKLAVMAKRRISIKQFYRYATTPNIHSDMLIQL